MLQLFFRFRLARAALLLAASVVITGSGPRIHLVPVFKPGDSFRYQIESRMATTGKTTTPIVNPQGATQLKQSVSILLRLDVLEVQPGANATPGPMRLRATYEKSTASSETDAYDPNSAALVDQYNHLEGRSMEFTVNPDGKLVDFKGLDDMLSNPSAAQTVRSWMSGLSSSAGLPPGGIEVGQKWSKEESLTGIPLDRLFWRTEATYLRNELCPDNTPALREDAAAKAPNANSPMCAVILTRITVVRHGAHGSHADETPDDYRRNGLRTSGIWNVSGESLDYVSLSNGYVIRSAQSGTQDVDFTVTSTRTGSQMSYKGKIETDSQINLLPTPGPQRP
jgi:hypothetical protein